MLNRKRMAWQKVSDKKYEYKDVKNDEKNILITVIRDYLHHWTVSIKGVDIDMDIPFTAKIRADMFIKTFIKKHRRGMKQK